MDKELLGVVQAFHTKIDNGFARLHDRLDVQKGEISSLRQEAGEHSLKLETIVQNHLTAHPPASTCPTMAVLDQHLQDHPDKAKVATLVKSAEENHQDKRAVVKTVASWAFKGIILAALAKLGLEKYWS